MDNSVLQTIMGRRSVRAYKPGRVDKKMLEQIVQAGSFAPNGSGEQGWHFSVVQEAQLLERINQGAKDMARHMGMEHLVQLGENASFNCLYGAPCCIIVSALEEAPSAEQDAAAAVMNMLIAAQSLGVASCWVFFPLMALYPPMGEALLNELRIPKGYVPKAAAIFGYAKGDAPPAAPRREDMVTWLG